MCQLLANANAEERKKWPNPNEIGAVRIRLAGLAWEIEARTENHAGSEIDSALGARPASIQPPPRTREPW
jgi:hypothetical protein